MFGNDAETGRFIDRADLGPPDALVEEQVVELPRLRDGVILLAVRFGAGDEVDGAERICQSQTSLRGEPAQAASVVGRRATPRPAMKAATRSSRITAVTRLRGVLRTMSAPSRCR